MKSSRAALPFLFAAVMSCTSFGRKESSKLRDNTSIPEVTCAIGMPTSFTFGDLGFVADRSRVRFHVPPAHGILYDLFPQSAGQAPYVRLDTCLNDETIILRRVVFLQSPLAIQSILDVNGQAIVNGLHDAIFLDDQSKLNIRVPNSLDPANTFVIRGWKQANGKTFATAFFASMQGASLKPNSIELLTGKLVAGDPVTSQNCAPGLIFKTALFHLGTAKIEWDTCQGLGGGQTTSYNVVALRITDSNSVLTSDERQIRSFESPESVQEVLQTKWGHHNACDSFVLKLPAATYAATSSPSAGCNEQLSGAPQRQSGDDAEWKTKFTVSYRGAVPTSGLLNCGHYLFFCENVTPDSENSFNWEYSNHQWNGLSVRFGANSLVIDTPQGDDATPQRNVGPGFRPKVIYNRITLITPSGSVRAEKWSAPTGSDSKIFCQPVSQLVDVSQQTFPTDDWATLRSKFGVPAAVLSSTLGCVDFKVDKPDMRPGFPPETLMPTGDLLCMASPKTLTGQGPNLVMVWVPMAYHADQVQPFLFEWPKETAKVCIDGQGYSVRLGQ